MLELTQITLTLPVLTDAALSWMSGFVTLWFCLGSLAFFAMSVTEMFCPNNVYQHGSMFPRGCTLREELILVATAVTLWPALIYIIYNNIDSIRWDIYKRDCINKGDKMWREVGPLIGYNQDYLEDFEDDV
ncbi:hypothetical protein SIPHO059v1_p0075 [Vibrio phage 264E42.1]|nr:hypothetical protein SIPHO059v1_p0075 [Vibrio phage 264E42.1]